MDNLNVDMDWTSSVSDGSVKEGSDSAKIRGNSANTSSISFVNRDGDGDHISNEKVIDSKQEIKGFSGSKEGDLMAVGLNQKETFTNIAKNEKKVVEIKQENYEEDDLLPSSVVQSQSKISTDEGVSISNYQGPNEAFGFQSEIVHSIGSIKIEADAQPSTSVSGVSGTGQITQDDSTSENEPDFMIQWAKDRAANVALYREFKKQMNRDQGRDSSTDSACSLEREFTNTERQPSPGPASPARTTTRGRGGKRGRSARDSYSESTAVGVEAGGSRSSRSTRCDGGESVGPSECLMLKNKKEVPKGRKKKSQKNRKN